MDISRLLTSAVAAPVVVISVIASPASAEDPAKADAAVEAYVEEWREANGVPGAAVAVVDGDEVRTYLSGEDGDGDPVSTETPFLVGSVAKTFTSALVLGLVEDGRIRLDDPVNRHLTWLDAPTMTVRQLLTHTTGYTAGDGLAVSERFDNEPGALRRAAADLEHHGTPGEYAYNSADYLVLGALLEEITGSSFAAVAQEDLFEPLGMTDTAADADGASTLAPGHRHWWAWTRSYDPGFDESGAPYGYVISTLDDLVTYARAQLAGQVLPRGIAGEAWSIQEVTGPGRGYGYGWSIDGGDHRRVHHTGATPGYFAHLSLIPGEDRAVVVLANSYAEKRAPSLSAAAADIDEIFGGGSATVRAGDPLLSAMPWLLAGLLPIGLMLTLVARHLPASPRLRWVCAVIAGAAAVGLALLPRLLGGTLGFAISWLPDLAIAVVAGSVMFLLAAVSWAIRPTRDAGTPRRSGQHPPRTYASC
ncbi:CubicO group peptidase, beta-lactamase class C family [Nocardioides sp. YR527]|uniref:serine hydrolase domain-containing protein n=1 Tax=Nocardioides sp. YR527 TaxID=1881028 RepID=UPI000884728E|nr:serine hydrolase domain-containing protein [Nocardioides sp. YR527]SDK64559.1 CubicO group peptidase, beta-lactamase class C family [Nocardioides sp. YR527]